MLANDTPAHGLTLASVTSPSHGTAEIAGTSVVYHAAARARGSDTFDYEVVDDALHRAHASVSIELLPMNHPPRFSPGGDVTVREDDPAPVVAWASAIDAGDDDVGQTVHFEVSTDDTKLFSQEPHISPQVSWPLARGDEFGTAEIEVTAIDNGGTEHGGTATSSTARFAIDVLPVDDAPSFDLDGDVVCSEMPGGSRGCSSRTCRLDL